MSETMTSEKREAFQKLLDRMGPMMTSVREKADERFSVADDDDDDDSDPVFHGVTVHVAEDGTNTDVPAPAWTTPEGRIFLREEILRGVNPNGGDAWGVGLVLNALRQSDVPALENSVRWEGDRIKAVMRTVVAAVGVLGHEYSHAAHSEMVGRDAWAMVLEDLRIESLWMDADPIRARQALRASGTFWLLGKSPMDVLEDPTVDLSHIRDTAHVLELHLLVGGRVRIGVLDAVSPLARSVSEIVSALLDPFVVLEADEIVDRYLETERDWYDPDGIRERAALAARMRALLGPLQDPFHQGCGGMHGPDQDDDQQDGGVGTQQGAGGDQGGIGNSGQKSQGEGQDGGGQESGTAESKDSSDSGSDSGSGDDDGIRIGVMSKSDGDAGSKGGEGGGTEETQVDVLSGEFGLVDTSKIDTTSPVQEGENGSRALTPEELANVKEALTVSLTDETGPNSTSWALGEEGVERILAQRVNPAREFRRVFSAKARTSRNRRLKG